MLIGVISDIHDNVLNLERILAIFKDKGVDQVIFCGDFCSPVPAKKMGESGLTFHCVFGNGDGDRFTIQKFATTDFPNLKLYGEYAELQIDGKSICVTHYPLYGQALARTGDYDAVFVGHTHQASEDMVGKTLYVNPGDIMGLFGEPSYGLYDTSTNQIEIVKLMGKRDANDT